MSTVSTKKVAIILNTKNVVTIKDTEDGEWSNDNVVELQAKIEDFASELKVKFKKVWHHPEMNLKKPKKLILLSGIGGASFIAWVSDDGTFKPANRIKYLA